MIHQLRHGPAARLAEARLIAAAPERHGGAAVTAACNVLMWSRDPADHRRAEALQEALRQEMIRRAAEELRPKLAEALAAARAKREGAA